MINPLFAADKLSLDAPPESLQQWYKPVNKRQVWLHTMFKLRREMQAVSEYSKLEDASSMKKWTGRLQKHYNKIAEMVPEWEQKIKPRLLSELMDFIDKGDFYRARKTLGMIQDTCDSCHDGFQPQVTAIYRSPGYDDISVGDIDGDSQSFRNNMQDLSLLVNRTLIALADDNKPVALQASHDLGLQLDNLAESCASCHKKEKYPRERILGKETKERLEALQQKIETDQVKDSQKLMGEIAVTVCARCHNTHRIISDLRNTLMPE